MRTAPTHSVSCRLAWKLGGWDQVESRSPPPAQRGRSVGRPSGCRPLVPSKPPQCPPSEPWVRAIAKRAIADGERLTPPGRLRRVLTTAAHDQDGVMRASQCAPVLTRRVGHVNPCFVGETRASASAAWSGARTLQTAGTGDVFLEFSWESRRAFIFAAAWRSLAVLISFASRCVTSRRHWRGRDRWTIEPARPPSIAQRRPAQGVDVPSLVNAPHGALLPCSFTSLCSQQCSHPPFPKACPSPRRALPQRLQRCR